MSDHTNSYQWKYREETYAPDHMSKIAEAVYANSNKLHQRTIEKIADLNAMLKSAYIDLIDKVCTPHQANIIKLLMQGYSQTEVAKLVGVKQQVTITCALNGRHNYKEGQAKYHGGAKIKLLKAAKESQLINRLKREIRILSAEDFEDYLDYKDEMMTQ